MKVPRKHKYTIFVCIIAISLIIDVYPVLCTIGVNIGDTWKYREDDGSYTYCTITDIENSVVIYRWNKTSDGINWYSSTFITDTSLLLTIGVDGFFVTRSNLEVGDTVIDLVHNINGPTLLNVTSIETRIYCGTPQQVAKTAFWSGNDQATNNQTYYFSVQTGILYESVGALDDGRKIIDSSITPPPTPVIPPESFPIIIIIVLILTTISCVIIIKKRREKKK